MSSALIRIVFELVRILFLAIHIWAVSQGTSRLPDANESNDLPLGKPGKTRSHTSLATAPEEKDARDLIKSWCSAYRQSDSERLAALEVSEVEIVDRFGDWHHLTELRDRKGFWREGFDMVLTKDFRPECTIDHVRLIRMDVAIVQARITYDQEICLKGGDSIPSFSEIHTFVLIASDGAWLISAQDIVQHISLEVNAKKELAPATQHILSE